MLFGLAMVFIPLVLGYFFKVSQPRIMRWVDRVVSACLYIIWAYGIWVKCHYFKLQYYRYWAL